MCVNEELKMKIRRKLDHVVLMVKVAHTVEEHDHPDGGDAVVEVLMEELMKLHRSYGREKCCGDCGCGGEILRCAQDDEERCGDSCGSTPSPDEGWACQDEEPCPCPGITDTCDCTRTVDLSFGCALEYAKIGARIARKGWNGKNQYVFLAKELEFNTDADLSAYEEHGVFVHDALAIKTAADQIQIGWLASQSDMLSNDWYIVE